MKSCKSIFFNMAENMYTIAERDGFEALKTAIGDLIDLVSDGVIVPKDALDKLARYVEPMQRVTRIEYGENIGEKWLLSEDTTLGDLWHLFGDPRLRFTVVFANGECETQIQLSETNLGISVTTPAGRINNGEFFGHGTKAKDLLC